MSMYKKMYIRGRKENFNAIRGQVDDSKRGRTN